MKRQPLPTQAEINIMLETLEILVEALRSDQPLSDKTRGLLADLLEWQREYVLSSTRFQKALDAASKRK